MREFLFSSFNIMPTSTATLHVKDTYVFSALQAKIALHLFAALPVGQSTHHSDASAASNNLRIPLP